MRLAGIVDPNTTTPWLTFRQQKVKGSYGNFKKLVIYQNEKRIFLRLKHE